MSTEGVAAGDVQARQVGRQATGPIGHALRDECMVMLAMPFEQRFGTAHGDAFYEAVLRLIPPRWRRGKASSAEYFADCYCLACDGLVSNPFDDDLECARCGWSEASPAASDDGGAA